MPYGHISARDPQNATLLAARSMAPVLVTAEDIIEFDLDSNPRARRREPAVLRARDPRRDLQGAARCDGRGAQPFAEPDSILQQRTRLRPMVGNAAFLGEGAPVFDIRDVDDEGDLNVCNVPQA